MVLLSQHILRTPSFLGYGLLPQDAQIPLKLVEGSLEKATMALYPAVTRFGGLPVAKVPLNLKPCPLTVQISDSTPIRSGPVSKKYQAVMRATIFPSYSLLKLIFFQCDRQNY
ncbi:hypothetical protein BDV26DRAFT_133186 [Aspergillus bertholletiae]|uniref:Uncharacterized protein n=1 Tax=Aspergillus bertholletiae TaxID=1226010 RepID=A0A5N7BFV4_9EURO|nr:hypothetical protein BDV26DRAFT_133186 [Aspergillus bertholletiae]